MLHQVGDLFELNVKLWCQKVHFSFIVYLETLSVTQSVRCRIIRRHKIFHWKYSGRKRSWPISWYSPGIFQEGLTKSNKYVNMDNRCCGRDVNPGTSWIEVRSVTGLVITLRHFFLKTQAVGIWQLDVEVNLANITYRNGI